MPAEVVADEVFGILLLFVRTGSALLLLPGFGEPYVLGRFRLLLGLLLAVILAGPLGPGLPAMPAEPVALARLLGTEALLGVFLGAAARLLFAALHVAGTVIAFRASPRHPCSIRTRRPRARCRATS